MSLAKKSGIAVHLNQNTLAGVLQQWNGFNRTNRIIIRNTGANAFELFLTNAAAGLGAGNGWDMAVGATIDIEVDIANFWTLGVNVSSFDALLITRS